LAGRTHNRGKTDEFFRGVKRGATTPFPRKITPLPKNPPRSPLRPWGRWSTSEFRARGGGRKKKRGTKKQGGWGGAEFFFGGLLWVARGASLRLKARIVKIFSKGGGATGPFPNRVSGGGFDGGQNFPKPKNGVPFSPPTGRKGGTVGGDYKKAGGGVSGGSFRQKNRLWGDGGPSSVFSGFSLSPRARAGVGLRGGKTGEKGEKARGQFDQKEKKKSMAVLGGKKNKKITPAGPAFLQKGEKEGMGSNNGGGPNKRPGNFSRGGFHSETKKKTPLGRWPGGGARGKNAGGRASSKPGGGPPRRGGGGGGENRGATPHGARQGRIFMVFSRGGGFVSRPHPGGPPPVSPEGFFVGKKKNKQNIKKHLWGGRGIFLFFSRHLDSRAPTRGEGVFSSRKRRPNPWEKKGQRGAAGGPDTVVSCSTFRDRNFAQPPAGGRWADLETRAKTRRAWEKIGGEFSPAWWDAWG